MLASLPNSTTASRWAGWLAGDADVDDLRQCWLHAGDFSAASMVRIDALSRNLGVGVETIPANTSSGWFIGSGLETRLDELDVLGQG